MIVSAAVSPGLERAREIRGLRRTRDTNAVVDPDLKRFRKLWPDIDREEWFSLGENHQKVLSSSLHQLRNRYRVPAQDSTRIARRMIASVFGVPSRKATSSHRGARQRGMSIEHTVLVVAQEDDPQFSMLKGLRHIVGREPGGFCQRGEGSRGHPRLVGAAEVDAGCVHHVPGRSLGAFALGRIG